MFQPQGRKILVFYPQINADEHGFYMILAWEWKLKITVVRKTHPT
jgi:hypothetical protein